MHQEDIWKKEWNFAGSRKFEHNDTSSDEFGKLLVIEKELFWMLSNYDCEKKKLYKSFQYIGPKEMAKRFNYQICLKSSDDRRQFLFKSVMDDDNRNGSDAFESPNCTVIDFSVLKSFSTYSPENKLKYLYTITRLWYFFFFFGLFWLLLLILRKTRFTSLIIIKLFFLYWHLQKRKRNIIGRFYIITYKGHLGEVFFSFF